MSASDRDDEIANDKNNFNLVLAHNFHQQTFSSTLVFNLILTCIGHSDITPSLSEVNCRLIVGY